jgi:hypothetical protein
MIKVEKRRPFGFKGDWGVLYKLYTYDDVQEGLIQYQNHNYLKIKTKVQLKAESKTHYMAQQVANLEGDGTQIVVETTDAYFDVAKKKYRCVVENGDIIEWRGDWWEVEKIDSRITYTPKVAEKYLCSLRRIDEEVIVW